MRAAFGGYASLVEKLIAYGADVDMVDKQGNRALDYVREHCRAQLEPILKQEEVKMRDYLSSEVRNVSVLGHSGVGKTSVL